MGRVRGLAHRGLEPEAVPRELSTSRGAWRSFANVFLHESPLPATFVAWLIRFITYPARWAAGLLLQNPPLPPGSPLPMCFPRHAVTFLLSPPLRRCCHRRSLQSRREKHDSLRSPHFRRGSDVLCGGGFVPTDFSHSLAFFRMLALGNGRDPKDLPHSWAL